MGNKRSLGGKGESSVSADDSFVSSDQSFASADESFASTDASFAPTDESFVPVDESFVPTDESFAMKERSLGTAEELFATKGMWPIPKAVPPAPSQSPRETGSVCGLSDRRLSFPPSDCVYRRAPIRDPKAARVRSSAIWRREDHAHSGTAAAPGVSADPSRLTGDDGGAGPGTRDGTRCAKSARS